MAPLIQASEHTCDFPTQSQADELVAFPWHLLAHVTSMCLFGPEGASVWGGLVWKEGEAEALCVCQSV